MGRAWSTRDFKIMIRDNGYEYVRTTGGHSIYKRGVSEISVPKKINKMIAQRLIKENSLII